MSSSYRSVRPGSVALNLTNWALSSSVIPSIMSCWARYESYMRWHVWFIALDSATQTSSRQWISQQRCSEIWYKRLIHSCLAKNAPSGASANFNVRNVWRHALPHSLGSAEDAFDAAVKRLKYRSHAVLFNSQNRILGNWCCISTLRCWKIVILGALLSDDQIMR